MKIKLLYLEKVKGKDKYKGSLKNNIIHLTKKNIEAVYFPQHPNNIGAP